MKHDRALRRKLGAAIAWEPAHDAYYIVAGMRPGAAGIPPLCITQRALLQLRSQIEQRRSELPFGLLSGVQCVAPESETHYLLVDEITAARRELTPDEPIEQLRTELRALASDAERRQKFALGWYLGGMDDDLELDPEVAALHHELFPEAWQIVLLTGQASGEEQGAILRFEARSDRFYLIPFSELLPEAAGRGEAKEAHTAVQWTNYRTAHPVSPIDASSIADVSATEEPSRGRELDLGAFLASLRRGARRTPTSDTSPAAAAPPPPARTLPSAAAPARRLEVSRPVSPSVQGSAAVRRIEAPSPAQEPAPAPAPPVPTPSAPPYLSLAGPAAAASVVPAPVVPSQPASSAPTVPAPTVPAPTAPAPAAPEPSVPEPSVSQRSLPERSLPQRSLPEPSPDLEVPQVFINGALVPLPDTNPPVGTLPPTDSAARRFLRALLGVALILLVALAAYLSFR